MQLFHRSHRLSASFDETNLVSAAGLVPAMALAVKTGLSGLTDQRLRLPGYFGANAGLKVTALVDIDDTIKEVHGYQKQGAGFGYSGVRGLNALLGIVSTTTSAPIIIGSRLRKGAAGSPRGAGKFVGDILATVRRLRSATASGLVLLRADSAFHGHAVVAAAHRAGARVSITARMDPAVKRAIATIPDTAWTTIQYTDAIRDETTGKWISTADVTEVAFTAFSSRKKADRIVGRLVVRRIPELNRFPGAGQPTLFDTHRFHAFFTTTDLDTVTADQTHRQHAIIEQVNADLKDSALAHLPSGIFTANAAWLVLATIAFNLSRAIGTLTGTELGKARSGTIRRKLISIPARISTSARNTALHLPERWPWEKGWSATFAAACGPPHPAAI